MAERPVDNRRRPYPNGRFVLELDDGHESGSVGLVHTVDGGSFQSETIGDRAGSEGHQTRYPGRQRFDDIVLETGTTMTRRFWSWVSDSLGNRPSRMNGAIVAYDFDGQERSRRSFFEALIAEVRFPALDAASKQPAHLTIKITAERIEWDAAGGRRQVDSGKLVEQKNWVCCNFRFRVDGLGEEMWSVHKVDAFAVRQQIISNPVGHELYVRREPGQIEYPNFSFHLPESHAGKWLAHWKRFVAEGERADGERNGQLEYMSNDGHTTLLAVRFEALGVTGVGFEKLEAGGGQIRSVKVDLYCESLSVERRS